MTSIVTQEKPFLPLVLQTQVARYLPKEDLADKARVSKAFKTVFENQQVWVEIAKKSNIPISDPKKSKQIVVAKHLEDVRKANDFLIEEGMNLQSWVGQAKQILRPISDPLRQRTELIAYLKMDNAIEKRVIRTIIMLLQGPTPQKYVIEAAKTLSKAGVDFLSQPQEEELFFWVGENIDEGFFKAHISGKKSTHLFSYEISKAIQHYSLKFLKLLLQRAEISNFDDIDVVISRVVSSNPEEKVRADEMLNMILEKYSNHPQMKRYILSKLDEKMRSNK